MISLPAAVATWSGWVGLGRMTGFGKVTLLPGIWDRFQLNTAVTLPIGVEAYAAFALSAALTSAPVADETRRFAWWSAGCALALGMGAQVAYHLLQNDGHTKAPWQITTVVSCLPVLVLGLGAVLAHLLHRDRTAAAAVVDERPAVAWESIEAPVWGAFRPDEEPPAEVRPAAGTAVEAPGEADEVRVPQGVPELSPEQVRAAEVFADEIAAGTVPSIRDVKKALRVGQPKAREVRMYLTALAQN